MTKRFLVFLIGFVFLGLAVFAQTPQENFQKAGQAELAKKEAILSQKKAEIEKLFDGIANDAVISGKEMKTLKKMVEDFDKTEKRFDKELEFYGLHIVTEVPATIRKHLKIYFERSKEDEDLTNLYFRDSTKQEIRKYFTERTGQDIKVEKGDNCESQFLLAFLLALVMMFLVVFLCLASERSDRALPLGLLAFALTLFFVFVLL